MAHYIWMVCRIFPLLRGRRKIFPYLKREKEHMHLSFGVMLLLLSAISVAQITCWMVNDPRLVLEVVKLHGVVFGRDRMKDDILSSNLGSVVFGHPSPDDSAGCTISRTIRRGLASASIFNLHSFLCNVERCVPLPSSMLTTALHVPIPSAYFPT